KPLSEFRLVYPRATQVFPDQPLLGHKPSRLPPVRFPAWVRSQSRRHKVGSAPASHRAAVAQPDEHLEKPAHVSDICRRLRCKQPASSLLRSCSPEDSSPG